MNLSYDAVLGAGAQDAPSPRGTLSKLQLFALTACTIGFMLDTSEIAVGSALGAIFKQDPRAAGVLPWLLASMYIGGILGAPICGHLADRFGRCPVLCLLVVVMALSSIGAALPDDLVFVTAARIVTGFAAGGYPPVMFAYVSEILPAKIRGRAIMTITAVAFMAPVATVMAVRRMTPFGAFGLEGWRCVLVLLGLLALIAFLLIRRIPSSPIWLLSRGRYADAVSSARRLKTDLPAATGRPADAAQPAEPRKGHFALFCLLLFLSPWATVAFPLLSGAAMIQKGLKLDQTLLVLAISSLAPIVGPALAAMAIDRVDRRIALASGAAVMVVASAIFAAASGEALILASMLMFYLVGSTHVSILALFTAEAFPVSARGWVGSVTWAFNRIASVTVPLVLLPLLSRFGATSIAAAVLASQALFVALLQLAPSKLQGRPLR